MHRLLTTLRDRAITRTLRGTTYCERCGEVCPASCRREALRERYLMDAQRSRFFHL